MQEKRRAILVVGAPRSGTSAAAQVISRLGVNFGNPDRFIDPQLNRHNPIFFELESLNRINDAIFGYFDKEWSDFDWLPKREVFSESVSNLFYSPVLQFIEQEFQNSPIIGLKDPRFCFTLPLWESVLNKIGFNVQYVLVRRSAQDIFKSNHSINQQPPNVNFRLVAHSYLMASEFIKSRPSAVLQYEDLLSAPRQSIQEVCRVLSLPSDNIDNAIASINKKLRHHNKQSAPSDYRYFSEIVDKRLDGNINASLYEEVCQSVSSDINKKSDNFAILNPHKLAYIENLSRAPITLLRIFNALWSRFDRQSIRQFIHTILAHTERDYRIWLKVFDSASTLSRQIHLSKNPLISVILPVYNPPIKFLDEAIKSVRQQTYPHWELCIADDASSDPAVRELIIKHAKEDSRIRYTFRPENGHISAASNSALELASGEYSALLDHDDLLHPRALQFVAEAINLHPEAEIIYSDEDKLDPNGNRKDPYFKPDFNYDLFLSQNMISHLGVYKTETMRKIGGFRVGMEGSQDYDLALRTLATAGSEKIIHIPRVLYHWRISEQSVASGSEAKPYAFTTGLSAINLYLLQKGVTASVRFFPQASSYQVIYAPPRPRPTIAFILLKSYTPSQIQALLESVSEYPASIYLIWNRSRQGEVPPQLQAVSGINIIEQPNSAHNIGALNQALQSLNEEYLCFLSADADSFSENWLDVLIGRASQPDAGAISPILLRKNQRLHGSGMITQEDGTLVNLFSGLKADRVRYYGWSHLARNFSVVSEKYFLIKREHFLAAGEFANIFSTFSYAVADLCMRLLKMGKRNVVIPYASIQIESPFALFSNIKKIKDKRNFRRIWKDDIAFDPAFNPNLTVKFSDIRFITQHKK
ncbi:MAG: glycosyltransferase [Anaerolineales bacterium]|nr:glycosyltransferase [Anaerolineales bacterium]